MARGGKREGAGRKKGSVGKLVKIERALLIQYCEETGANPFTFWADILSDTVDPKLVESAVEAGLDRKAATREVLREHLRLKDSAAKNLAPYLLGQLRSQELTFTQPEAQEKLAELLGLKKA